MPWQEAKAQQHQAGALLTEMLAVMLVLVPTLLLVVRVVLMAVVVLVPTVYVLMQWVLEVVLVLVLGPTA